MNTVLFLVSNPAALAQDSASLSGMVVDPSDAVVPGASVTLTNIQRGTVLTETTSGGGSFAFNSLPPAEYSLEIVKAGFNKLAVQHIQLKVRDRQSLRLALQLSEAAKTSVNVTAAVEGISTDASTSTDVDRKFAENLPLNGRNVRSLIMMSPGITSAAGGKGGGGEFNVNGLRSNMNYYTMDGVSVNQSVSGGGGGPMGGGPRGGGFGGGMPMGGGGPMGGNMDMVSMDSVQQVRVQTAAFAPEFGRSPGAQISMTSRGGANQYHGSASEYLRNERLNANDWFANSSGYDRGEMRQNRFAGTFGGAAIRDRTFYFLSYEGLRLLAPDTSLTSVPDAATRASASTLLLPFLKAFPVANGKSLSDGAAVFTGVVLNRSTTNSGSLRIDHRFNERWNAFVRYSYAPSSNHSRGTEMLTPNTLMDGSATSQSVTASATAILDARTTNDVRVSYSRFRFTSISSMDNFGGATPLTDSVVFPSGITPSTGDFSLNVVGLTGYTYAGRMQNQQAQVNVVDGLTKMVERHNYKFGFDVRRTSPTNTRKPYASNVMFNGLSGDSGALLSGSVISAIVSANETKVYPKYTNVSLYIQDSFRVSERLTFTYGTRWEVNPAPGIRKGPRPFAMSNISECGVTQTEPLYETRWVDFAPRLGIAYQFDPTPGQEFVFRGGVGAFYDTGSGMTANVFSGAPYSTVRTLTSVAFPLSTSDLSVPSLPPVRPFGQVSTTDPNLKAPMIFQWNATLERWIGRGQMLSVGYAGSDGRRLLQSSMTPSYTDAYDFLMEATNGATSIYHALQVQYRRRLSERLQVQMGYSWSHAIDTASHDSAMAGFATMSGQDKGSSDFDVRHNLNISGSFNLFAPKNPFLRSVLGGWYLDWSVAARTGLPFDIQNISTTTSSTSSSSSSTKRGLYSMVRPSYIGYRTVWLTDTSVPGGRRLNANAFELNDNYVQGNLGRNVFSGFNAYQADFAVRRQIALGERLRLHVSAQAYNVLNHPNFANPSPLEGANLSSANFGVMTRMLNQGMGGSLGSVYSIGGPRSGEVSLRLQF